MEGRIITISRQCGSGGHSIGSGLAKRLDVPFYDREIIEMAAKESGFHKEFVEEKGEHMNSSLLYNIARYASYGGRGCYEEYQPLQDQLYFAQVKVIKELAEKGPCVIVGRCADYILRDRKGVLNVFIHADMAFKKKRLDSFRAKTRRIGSAEGISCGQTITGTTQTRNGGIP